MAAPGLGCGTQGFPSVVGSLAAAWELLVAACGIWFPHQGLNPGPFHWEHRILAAGPPGESPRNTFLNELLGLF